MLGDSGLVERLHESPDLRRHNEQVAGGLAAPCVAKCVRSSLRRRDRTARAGLACLLADPEPKHTLQDVPSLIVGMMNVQPRDPLVLGLT